MWLRGIGDAKDNIEYSAKEAVFQRMPDHCGADSLVKIGGERQLDRGTTETEAQWRERLKSAWELWPKAGTPEGILNALHFAGYDSVYLVCSNGEIWNRDSGTGETIRQVYSSGYVFTKGWWNEFRVLFVSPHPAHWSPSPPANDSDEVKNLRRIVNLWKPAKAKLDGFVVHLSGLIWGFPPSQQWGGSGLAWGGTTTFWTAE